MGRGAFIIAILIFCEMATPVARGVSHGPDNLSNALSLGYLVAADSLRVSDNLTLGNGSFSSRPSAGVWGSWAKAWTSVFGTSLSASWRSLHWRQPPSRILFQPNQALRRASLGGQLTFRFLRLEAGYGVTDLPIIEANSASALTVRRATRVLSSASIATLAQLTNSTTGEIIFVFRYIFPGSSNGIRTIGSTQNGLSFLLRWKKPWGNWLAKLEAERTKTRTSLSQGRLDTYALGLGLEF